MNKEICKFINNCVLYKREKASTQVYIPSDDRYTWQTFWQNSHRLVSDLNISASGNQHILTIIDLLMGWPEAFPIPDKKADTIVHIFSNNYLPVHMYPHFILSGNSTEFKNQVMDNIFQQLGIDCIFSVPYHPQIMENWRFSTNTLNLLLGNYVKRIWATGTNTLTKY